MRAYNVINRLAKLVLIAMIVVSATLSLPAFSRSADTPSWINTSPPVVTRAYVYRQGFVLDESGNKMFAEYGYDPDTDAVVINDPKNNNGKLIRVLEGIEGVDASDPDILLIGGSEYKATRDAIRAWKDSLPEGEWEKYQVVSAETYKSSGFASEYPEAWQAYLKVDPYYNSRSVLVYKPESLLEGMPINADDGIIVQQSKFHITKLIEDEGPAGKRSLIIDKQGEVKYQSDHNIGYRVAYFDPDNYTFEDGLERTSTNITRLEEQIEVLLEENGIKDSLLGPIPGVELTGGGFAGTAGITDEFGFTVVSTIGQACQFLDWGTGDEGDTQDSGEVGVTLVKNIYAEVPYITFNPARATSLHKLYVAYPFDYPCLVLSALYPVHTSLIGVMTSVALNDIAAGVAQPTIPRINIPVDVSIVTGTFNLYNGDEVVPIVKSDDGTRKDVEPLSFDDYQEPQSEDLNNDGNPDHVSDNGSIPQPDGSPDDAAPLYGVWFSVPEDAVMDDKNVPYTEDGDLIKPDLVRVATYKQSFDNVGLVKSISYTDLADTDIYVFRESTGQLVMEKKPFVQEGDNQGDGLLWGNWLSGIAEEEAVGGPATITAFFETRIPGRSGRNSTTVGMYSRSTNDYRAWQSGARVTAQGVDTENKQSHIIADDFQAYSETLRKGEPLRIIVINRATGYIGSKRINVEDIEKSTNPNTPTPYLNDSTIGVNIGEIQLFPPNLKINVKRHYEVEYGATQGDEKIYRVGSEGAALSSDQYIVITSEWLDEDGSPLPAELPGYTGRLTSLSSDETLKNSAEHFAIKPGLHTEIISLGDKGSKPTGAQYQYLHIVGEDETEVADFGASPNANNRPDMFVPFRVAVYDAKSTQLLKQALLEESIQENKTFKDPENSIYQWPHRPEMMYSIFDLDIAEILRTPEDENGEAAEPIDITNNETPVLIASDKELSIVQDLIASEYDPLEYFGPESHLIYSLEGYQQQVNEGEGQTYSFTDFGHLGELDSDDYLTLSLLNSQDAGNVLWEFAFEYLVLALANDEDMLDDNIVYLNADNPNIELMLSVIGYQNRDENSKPESIVWNVEKGDASIEAESDVLPENGVMRAVVTLEPFVENIVTVSARYRSDESTKVNSIEFHIIAGEAATMSVVESVGSAYVRQSGQESLTVSVLDAHGNSVNNGTPVTANVQGGARIVEKDSSTTDGKASLLVEGGGYSGQSTVRLRSGAASIEHGVNIGSLKATLEGVPTTFEPGARYNGFVKVTNIAGEAQEGVSVDLYSTGIDITPRNFLTDENGKIAFDVQVSDYSDGETVALSAVVDANNPSRRSVVVSAPANEPEKQLSIVPIASNGTTQRTVTLAGGGECSIDLRPPSLRLQGLANDVVKDPVESYTYPNRQAIFSTDFYHGGTQKGLDLNVQKNGIGKHPDSPVAGQFSARFSEDGRWQASHSNLRVSNPGVSVWLKLESDAPTTEKTIIKLGDSTLLLTWLSDQRLQLKVTSEAGTQVLTSIETVADGWRHVAFGRRAGQIYLQVGDEMTSATITSALQFSSAAPSFTVAGGLTMSAADLSFFDNSSPDLIRFNHDQHFDNAGLVDSMVTLGGELVGNNYEFDGQKIDFVHNNKHYDFLLVDDDTLASYVQVLSLKDTTVACDPKALLKAMGVSTANVPIHRAVSNARARLTMESTATPVALAKMALSWIALHPDNRGTTAAMVRLQGYLKEATHAPLARAMNEELDAAISDAKLGLKIRMTTLLTGLQVWSEMLDSNAIAADIMVENINSAADFWTWMRYLSLPGKGWAGDVIPMPHPQETCDQWQAAVNAGTGYAYNPKPCRVSGAIAGSSIVALQEADPDDSDNMTPLIAAIIDGLRGADITLTRMVFDDSPTLTGDAGWSVIKSAHANPVVTRTLTTLIKAIIKTAGRDGAENMIRFLKNQTNVRFDSKTLLMAMTYLETRHSDSSYPCTGLCKEIGDEDIQDTIQANMGRLILGVGLAKNGDVLAEPDKARRQCMLTNQAHGAAMELVLTAMYHALYEAGNSKYQILAADKLIRVPYVNYKSILGSIGYDEYGRKPDLILAGAGEEKRYWIEAKSWRKGKKDIKNGKLSASRWKWQRSATGLNKYSGAHRQYFIDAFATDRIEALSDEWVTLGTELFEKYGPDSHKTWVQVWDQETRDVWYKKKNTSGKLKWKKTYIQLATPWIKVPSNGAIASLGMEFPLLQTYLTHMPKSLSSRHLREMVGLNTTGYRGKLRTDAVGELNGPIAPFTFWQGLVSEVGAGTAKQITDRLINELADPEFFKQINPNNLTQEQIVALQDSVTQQLDALLGPIGDVLEKISELEKKALPDYINKLFDDIDNAVQEAVEGAAGDAIRDTLDHFTIPEAFGEELCESNL